MHSPQPPQEQMLSWRQDQQTPVAECYTPDNNCSHVQVIICSCSSHLVNTENIHIRSPHSSPEATSYPSLPTLTSLLSALLPKATASMPLYFSTQSEPSFTAFQLAQKHFQTLNLPSRAGRYIVNPFEIPGLLNRTRINVQGLLSVRLWFNIWCVIVWVLIRRFLEVFGVRIGGVKDT
ncbi:hypothetical protein BKA64DRAFT_374678 [Cadophora sp. MPI-SDFR-AT-0126]|nr:hypothetical protein BKA64DRAFT_374678 [Leotiomycetes sp. MPI-SDFR-AT-0126]